FHIAETAGRLLTIPTGDGITLVFYHSPEAPVECALEISRALKKHPELQLRMGVHSGPVSGVIDATGKANVAGPGINIAQRVMDCGDAGHILLSKRAAGDLQEYPHWQPHLHELGECEVKHGVRVSVVNRGDVIFKAGQRDLGLTIVLRGGVEVFEQCDGTEEILATARERDFIGDVAMLQGTSVLASARVTSEEAEILYVPAAELRRALAEIPDVSKTIVDAVIMRRRRLSRDREFAGMRVLAQRDERLGHKLDDFLDKNRIP